MQFLYVGVTTGGTPTAAELFRLAFVWCRELSDCMHVNRPSGWQGMSVQWQPHICKQQ